MLLKHISLYLSTGDSSNWRRAPEADVPPARSKTVSELPVFGNKTPYLSREAEEPDGKKKKKKNTECMQWKLGTAVAEES